MKTNILLLSILALASTAPIKTTPLNKVQVVFTFIKKTSSSSYCLNSYTAYIEEISLGTIINTKYAKIISLGSIESPNHEIELYCEEPKKTIYLQCYGAENSWTHHDRDAILTPFLGSRCLLQFIDDEKYSVMLTKE